MENGTGPAVLLIAMTSLTVFGCVSIWLFTRPIWSLVNDRKGSDNPGQQLDRMIRLRAAMPLTFLASLLLGTLVFLWSSLLLLGALQMKEDAPSLESLLKGAAVVTVVAVVLCLVGHFGNRTSTRKIETAFDQFTADWRDERQAIADRDGVVRWLLEETAGRASAGARKWAFENALRRVWTDSMVKEDGNGCAHRRGKVHWGLSRRGKLRVLKFGGKKPAKKRVSSVVLQLRPGPPASPAQDPLGWLALPAELAQGGRFEIWSRKQRAAAERALRSKLEEAWKEVRDKLPSPEKSEASSKKT